MRQVVVGITGDVVNKDGIKRSQCALAYAEAVTRAGGFPVLLPPIPEQIPAQVAFCDAWVLTGGDDPRTEEFGEPTHPAVTPLDPIRQGYEVALLRALGADRSPPPVLGVCLGMQLMALVAGGTLDQHLPDVLSTADDHWNRAHDIEPVNGSLLGAGEVHSRHRQAVSDPGALRVCARAADGVIEAVDDPDQRFYLGVQWHPERTADATLGANLFSRLVRAARG